jgi:hypothetical protein
MTEMEPVMDGTWVPDACTLPTVEAQVAARAADLTVRETQCCSFFGFTLTATGGGLTLDVTAPPEQIAVLDALVDRARTAAGTVTR